MDSNLESCRSKQARYQLSHPSHISKGADILIRAPYFFFKGDQAWKVRGRNFTEIRPVWIGELETRTKPYGFIFKFLSAKIFCDVGDSA